MAIYRKYTNQLTLDPATDSTQCSCRHLVASRVSCKAIFGRLDVNAEYFPLVSRMGKKPFIALPPPVFKLSSQASSTSSPESSPRRIPIGGMHSSPLTGQTSEDDLHCYVSSDLDTDDGRRHGIGRLIIPQDFGVNDLSEWKKDDEMWQEWYRGIDNIVSPVFGPHRVFCDRKASIQTPEPGADLTSSSLRTQSLA